MWRRPENVLRSATRGRLAGTVVAGVSAPRVGSRFLGSAGLERRGVGRGGQGRAPPRLLAPPRPRGGRSLAISTAIHGNGTEAATISNEIRPLCQAPYASAARISAGTRNAI